MQSTKTYFCSRRFLACQIMKLATKLTLSDPTYIYLSIDCFDSVGKNRKDGNWAEVVDVELGLMIP